MCPGTASGDPLTPVQVETGLLAIAGAEANPKTPIQLSKAEAL